MAEKLSAILPEVLSFGNIVMIAICLGLIWLAIVKKYEPLLLIPISIGGILSNAPGAGMAEPGGLLYFFYSNGLQTGIFPIIIFIGVGALTDFSPLLGNLRTALLGAAAQFGIFFTFICSAFLGSLGIDGIDISMQEAAAIAIIGGADGPTSIYVANKLAPDLLGAIAVAAYSYMALVPIIQPPIVRALTTEKERKISMPHPKNVSQKARILFPLVLMLLTILTIPSAVPLVGAISLGNLLRECGVVSRLKEVSSGSLLDMVTLFLGLSVGMKLQADEFLQVTTIAVLILGLIAFCFGTACGVLMAKLMNKFSSVPINPIIGAAGVSAVPMAARVASKLSQEADSKNILLMQAMGPNVAGVIGSAVAAGIFIALL